MHDRDLASTREAVLTVVEPAALEQRVPFGDLISRAARRRHRRWQIAAGVLVCLVGASLLLGKPAADRITQQPAATATATPSPTPTPLSNTMLVQSVMFSSPDAGYVVIIRCPGAGYRCAKHAVLMRTTDGARTWTVVPNPTDTLPGEEVRIDGVTETGLSLSVADRRYYTDDGGKTWHTRSVTAYPGAPMEAAPPSWDIIAQGGKLAALDPIRYEYHPLTHQPALHLAPNLGAVRSGPNRRIVATSDLGSHIEMAYSDDNGRSWHPISTPRHAHVIANMVQSAPGSERLYLAEGDVSYRLTGVYRLDHPGAEWVKLPIPPRVSNDPNSGTLKLMSTLPNGELVYSTDPPLITRDGGTKIGDAPLPRPYDVNGNVLPANVTIGTTMISTLPPSVRPPPFTVALLFSTDSAQSWQLRSYELPH